MTWGDGVHNKGTQTDGSTPFRIASGIDVRVWHYAVNSLDDIVERCIRYSYYEAEAWLAKGQTYSLYRHIRALLGVIWTYCARKPHFYRDGTRGFMVITFLLVSTHINWVRLWEFSQTHPISKAQKAFRSAKMRGMNAS